ncbi:IS6 family transposase [Ochrobactrum grignonense]|nr:IS6 family transposase [Brucella grignonensis]
MFKGRHFDKSVILLCVRWYLAYNLSLRNLKEMMAERGIDLDHSTVHRWVLFFSPKLLARFNRKKRQVTRKWNLDETYIKVKGEWFYLYRAIDSNGNTGDTVEFYFSKDRDLSAAKRFIRKTLARHGRPVRITIDGSQTNRTAILQCDAENRLRQAGKPIAIRSSKYMNNTIEQDHRRIKQRTRSMLGFKSDTTAGITLLGIELIHMMRKQQGVFADQKHGSLKQQFEALAA